MYDEYGNIVGAKNSQGQCDRYYTDMDTSAEGMTLKKQQEMEFIRRKTSAGSKKQAMYDEEGNLIAWKKLKMRDEDLDKSDNMLNNMDLSAAGMKMKKVRTLLAFEQYQYQV